MSQYLDFIFTTLDGEIKKQKRDIQNTRQITERSETAGGVTSTTLTNAPLQDTNAMSESDLMWIKDGCKPGEAEWAGTGVLAVFNPSTNQWLRVGDYVVVTT